MKLLLTKAFVTHTNAEACFVGKESTCDVGLRLTRVQWRHHLLLLLLILGSGSKVTQVYAFNANQAFKGGQSNEIDFNPSCFAALRFDDIMARFLCSVDPTYWSYVSEVNDATGEIHCGGAAKVLSVTKIWFSHPQKHEYKPRWCRISKWRITGTRCSSPGHSTVNLAQFNYNIGWVLFSAEKQAKLIRYNLHPPTFYQHLWSQANIVLMDSTVVYPSITSFVEHVFWYLITDQSLIVGNEYFSMFDM